MKRYIITLLVFIIIAVFNTQNSNAQYGSFGTTDAQTIGMGNTFGAAFGTLALGKNPAFLAYPRDTNSYVALQVPNFEFKALQSTLTMEDFNKYFGNKEALVLDDAGRKEFFNTFDDNNGLYYNVGSKLFALAWKISPEIGTFALSMTQYLSGNMNIPLPLIDLVINGNEQDKTYKFDDMEFKTWWIGMTTLSYARDILEFDNESFIKSLTGGVSLKIVSGYAYAGLERMDAEFTTGENNVLDGKVDMLAWTAFSPEMQEDKEYKNTWYNVKFPNKFAFLPETVGSGFGFDLGFAADLSYNLRAGLAITDIGSITWDSYASEHSSNSESHIDDLLKKSQRDRLDELISDSSYAVSSFSTSLPTALRLSIAYDISKTIKAIPGDLTVLFGYNQGFNDSPGNSTDPRVAFGVRWQTSPFIPVISTGFSNNRAGDLVWTFGIGWSTSVLDFCIATQDLSTLLGSSGNPFASFAMNFIWKINY
ncbi:MAG: DUF5723 family protein [bacterium]